MKKYYFFLLILLCSCCYRIKQTITSSIWYDNPIIHTEVVKVDALGFSKTIIIWTDEINLNTKDSIKCLRYKQAKLWCDKLKNIEKYKCK